ncbi:MAG: hypothetical protein ABR927_16215 [Bacteroidales bacterium]
MKYKIEKLPIKNLNKDLQQPFIRLVNKILSINKSDSFYDIKPFEIEIDRLVYELYGLTEEEIRIVEGTD